MITISGGAFSPVRLLACLITLILFLPFTLSPGEALAQRPAPPGFRVERMPILGGAELITIFGKPGTSTSNIETAPEAPLASVLRDTLGDADPENDRLRYVWVFSYTRPTWTQQAMASVPFFYSRADNKKDAGSDPPPPVIDLANPNDHAWQGLFWSVLQNLLFDSQGFWVKASTRAFRRNSEDYKKAHVMRALAILSLYESEGEAEPGFTESELREIQARLVLTEKKLGMFVDDTYLQKIYQKNTSGTLDVRGHNWELLRQRCEAEGLYFEPLAMPDRSPTHALIWVERADLERNQKRRFSSRFLSIASPWGDKRLRNWNGFVETRYFDAENRLVEPDTPGATARELIPLAIYGLDHPHIPILLVDFRDGLNPKRREMSRRATGDLVRNVLALSRFGDIRYFVARAVYEFVTGRRGADLNQPSRFRAYSQLKLLLSLNQSLSPELGGEISGRLERVSMNPIENDLEYEVRLARDQYSALLSYAQRPDGLPKRLLQERGVEMREHAHDRTGRFLFRLGNIVSLGMYQHREEITARSSSALELNRRVAHHTRFLREVAKSSPQIEVVWNMDDVRRSLRLLAENRSVAGRDAVSLAAAVFRNTRDEGTRLLCLDSLRMIDTKGSRAVLLSLSRDQELEPHWRELCAVYLNNAGAGERGVDSGGHDND